jgi:hypothetical protein
LEIPDVTDPNTIVKGVRVRLPYWVTMPKVLEFGQIEGFVIDIHGA